MPAPTITVPTTGSAPASATLDALEAQVNAGLATNFDDIAAHKARTDNPHAVTKAQVGLPLVDNTSDADKPVSTATQAALDGKLDLSATTAFSRTLLDDADAATMRTTLGLGAMALRPNVVTADIADSAIATAKIADAAVTEAKIAPAVVTAGKIGTGAVTEPKIGPAAVTADKIGPAAVTTAKIADANVTEAKLAPGVVTEGKIGASAVTTAKIADANVTTAKIADANVTEAKVAPAAITTAKIADANVTAAKIAPGAVVTAGIADDAVTTPKIPNLAVTEAKIATGGVTSGKIGTAAVTTVKIADANVTTAKIADGNVTEPKIGPAAVTTAKIADANVTAAKIAPGAVVTAGIADANVTLAKIATQAEATVLGRAAGAGTGIPQVLTATQAKALLALGTADIAGLTAALDAKLATSAKATEEQTVAGSSTTAWVTPKGVAAAIGVARQAIRQEVVNQAANTRVGATVQPGLTPWRFCGALEGMPASLAAFDESGLANTDRGFVWAVYPGRAGVTGIVATLDLIRLEPGRKYLVRWTGRKRLDSADPAGDATQFGVAWLNASGQAQGLATTETVIANRTSLTAADGWVTNQAVIAAAAGAGVDHANAQAVYARPFVRQFGSGERPVLEISVLTFADITDNAIVTDTAADAEARLSALENRTPYTSATAAVDLNALIAAGLWHVDSPVNGPAGGPSSVIVAVYRRTEDILEQVLMPATGSTPGMWLRIRTAGSWSAWMQMADRAYVDALVQSLANSVPVLLEPASTAPAFVTNTGSFTATYYDDHNLNWQRIGNWCHFDAVCRFKIEDDPAPVGAGRLILPLPYTPVANRFYNAAVQPLGNVPTPAGFLQMVGEVINDGTLPIGVHIGYSRLDGGTGSEKVFYSIQTAMSWDVIFAFGITGKFRIDVGP